MRSSVLPRFSSRSSMGVAICGHDIYHDRARPCHAADFDVRPRPRYGATRMPTDPSDLAVTEQENPRSRDIASMSIADAVALINDEDARVAEAVRLVLP